MKKLLSVLICVLTIAGCFKDAPVDLKGKNFKTQDSETKMEITLGFDKEAPRYFGKAVNNYFGNYEQKDNKLTFSPAGATMMAAPVPLMKAESEYFAFLATVESFEIKGKQLILSGKDGKKIAFDEYTPSAEEK